MSYLVWVVVGILVALLVGSSARRRSFQMNVGAPVFAGAFGGLIGGVIGDGMPAPAVAHLTPLSVVGAVIGALILCWAVHSPVSDTKP